MRLIDADELMGRIEQSKNCFFNTTDKEIALNYIDQAPTADPWHYPSKGEYPDENGEYLFLIEAFSNIYRVVGDYEVLKNQRLWSAQVADEWVEDEPIAWMPLPEPPMEIK